MQRIGSIDDPRIAAYRNLRDRTLRGEGIFVAEGRLLVHRLLNSVFATESVLVAEPFAEEFARAVPAGVPLYLATEEVQREIVGFNFHRGVLAAGLRHPLPSISELLDGFVAHRCGEVWDKVEQDVGGPAQAAPKPACAGLDGSKPAQAPDGPPGTRLADPSPPRAGRSRSLVVLPDVTKPENLGLIVRSAAALGAGGVLLGERCCDPLSRRALRLSMGSVLQVPLARSIDLAADLVLLKQRFGYELFAAVLDADAESLPGVHWPDCTAILFGNEFDGLRAEWHTHCSRRVTIPMHAGVDSLNLGVAAGVFLYDLQRGSQPAGGEPPKNTQGTGMDRQRGGTR